MVAARPLPVYDHEYDHRRGPVPVSAPRRRPKSTRKRVTGRRPAVRRRSVSSASFLLTLAVVAMLLFGLGVRFATLSSTGRQLVDLKKELAQLDEEKFHLMAEISSLAAPDRVEGGAREALGMIRPAEIRSVQVANLQPTPLVPTAGTSAVVQLPQANGPTAVEDVELAGGGWLDRTAGSFYQWLAGGLVEARTSH